MPAQSKSGDEVEVVEGGAMRRAQVRRVVDQAEGTYELSLWSRVTHDGRKYEAGFDTLEPSWRRRPAAASTPTPSRSRRSGLDPNPDPNLNPNLNPNPCPNPLP